MIIIDYLCSLDFEMFKGTKLNLNGHLDTEVPKNN